MKNGVSLEKLLSISEWRESGLFDTRERLALELAERVSYSDQDVDEPFFARLLAGFGEVGLVELTAAIACQNMLSKFNHTFRIEAQGFCPLPKAKSPPS
jgi:alkylhydroperoxidase family enzyme